MTEQEQEVESKWMNKLVFVVVVIAAVIASLAVYFNFSDEEKTVIYPDELRQQFISDCVSENTSEALCACTFDQISQRLSVEEYQQLDQRIKSQTTTEADTTLLSSTTFSCAQENPTL